MKRFIFCLALVFGLVGCSNQAPTADNGTVPVDNTPAAPASTALQASTLPPAQANPYPKGMAQTWEDCGKPGYNSDNGLCHPVGAPMADQASDAGLPPAINAINDQLAKLGSLSVTTTNAQGYPVFNMECNAQQQCVNGVGIPMGSLPDVAKEMTPVRQTDIVQYGYRCHLICKDGEGNIIGRPEVQ